MKLKDALECGYYDEDTGKDYIVEINEKKLKKYLEQEKPELLNFDKDIEKQIVLYDILEKEMTKEISHYNNFTVKFK